MANSREVKREKTAAEEARVLAQMGKGSPPPDEGSDFGTAAGLTILLILIVAAIWWFGILHRGFP